MNKSNLKSYAPQARKDFIAAVTARANLLGLSDKAGTLEVAPAQTQGDITVIAGQAWPAKVSGQRDRLVERIRKDGFAQTIEAIAYTWFNRFAALRYMELHDYLSHGHRALSSTSGGLPDILTYATDLASELPGLNATKVTELKVAGNRDGELYRMLLVAQCNALSIAMPFLFERIDDDSELLLPDNLLRSDSVIAKLVADIPEEDWAEVEIIGWLYQFYISEKKDQVIGKVVKSEDIPAATQLFTPNWIVQYLVQNSVGRLWLMANPQSTLASEWPYYITPAEQTPEVQAQLDALIQTRVQEDGDTLNPESITVLDPACGSGHILVVAYDVLKAIYLERGYQPRSIPRLILEKNLYGLDIDDRAAQMAGFALLMKARADDRRLFTTSDDAGNLQPCSLNVLSMQESKGLDAAALAQAMNSGCAECVDVVQLRWLIDNFEHAKSFGSLIQIGTPPTSNLRKLLSIVQQVVQTGDLYAKAAAHDVLPLVQQALVLGMQFDAVVANPPYMGDNNMNGLMKSFANHNFPDSKSDLFACFIERSYTLAKKAAHISMVTMQTWMFLSSFEKMRERILKEKTITSMTQIGFNSFPSLNSKVALATAFSIANLRVPHFRGSFLDLNSAPQSADKGMVFRELTPTDRYLVSANNFMKVPGSPIAYWASEKLVKAFENKRNISSRLDTAQGMKTLDNERFVRNWQEISIEKSSLFFNPNTDVAKWYPINHGGDFRKWFGNNESVINWEKDGAEIKSLAVEKYNSVTRTVTGMGHYFKAGVTWTSIGILFGARYFPSGFLFTNAGMCAFADESTLKLAACMLNSNASTEFLRFMSPTLNFGPNQVKKIPFPIYLNEETCSQLSDRLIALAKDDWDAYERSWDFQSPPILTTSIESKQSLKSSYTDWISKIRGLIDEMGRLEEENNRLFIDAYGLADELGPAVPLEKITLTMNPVYRYGGRTSEVDHWTRFRQDSMNELVSYAIGCMMGRYSLDEPGLIYARAGNIGFDPSRYATFPADADGIVPITDELWFADDAPNRIREFLLAVWGLETLEENMAWLAESLGTKVSETPDEAIRRYIADKFFKDHLQTYKKRPIYWLFSSGKQGAFQALVYLHRYNEGTLARLRAEYVVPLTSKMQARIEMLQKDAAAATSTSARNKLAKEVEKLNKKHAELLAYDEKLRHYADMRISLDLDDGVKVNYGKFGDLLEGVKIVTGGSADD